MFYGCVFCYGIEFGNKLFGVEVCDCFVVNSYSLFSYEVRLFIVC